MTISVNTTKTKFSLKEIPVFLALFVNFIFLTYLVVYFVVHKYLPSPMFYDKGDFLGDLYKPLVGLVSTGSPPLYGDHYPYIFYFLLYPLVWSVRFFNENAFNVSLFAIIVQYIIFVCVLYIRQRQTKNNNGALGIVYLIVLATSLPMLFEIERGNSVLVAAIFLGICAVGRAKNFFYPAAIVVKPYLLTLAFVYFKCNSRRRALVWIFIGLLTVCFELIFRGVEGSFIYNVIKFGQSNYASIREALSLQYSPTFLSLIITNPSVSSYLGLGSEAASYISKVIQFACLVPLLYFISFLLLFGVSREDEGLAMLTIIACSILASSKTAGYSLILLYPFSFELFRECVRRYIFYIFLILVLPLEPLVVNFSQTVKLEFTLFGNQGSEILWEYSIIQSLRTLIYFVFCSLLVLHFRRLRCRPS